MVAQGLTLRAAKLRVSCVSGQAVGKSGGATARRILTSTLRNHGRTERWQSHTFLDEGAKVTMEGEDVWSGSRVGRKIEVLRCSKCCRRQPCMP